MKRSEFRAGQKKSKGMKSKLLRTRHLYDYVSSQERRSDGQLHDNDWPNRPFAGGERHGYRTVARMMAAMLHKNGEYTGKAINGMELRRRILQARRFTESQPLSEGDRGEIYAYDSVLMHMDTLKLGRR